MFTKKEQLEDIRYAFGNVQNSIQMAPSDDNAYAEDLVRDVLNAFYGWGLVNTKTPKRTNFPCIDLLDDKKQIGVQVSSEEGSEKITETIECLKGKADLLAQMSQLLFFSLVPKQRKYTITATCPGVAFAWKNDIKDFSSFYGEVSAAKDDAKIAAVHDAVTHALPKLFASRANLLLAIRDELRANLVLFKREVMEAPFQRENPLDMYRAIKEIRVGLQKSGASLTMNEVAAKNFEKAHRILRDCEYEVRASFPAIADAAEKGQFSVQDQSDYYKAITLMMGIRSKLEPLLNEINGEMKMIEAKLK